LAVAFLYFFLLRFFQEKLGLHCHKNKDFIRAVSIIVREIWDSLLPAQFAKKVFTEDLD
jgi:hypothetical protein